MTRDRRGLPVPAALIAMALAVALTGCGNLQAPTDRRASGPVASGSVASVDPARLPERDAWQMLDLPGLERGSTVATVAATGRVIVIAGSVRRHPAAWSSADGTAWVREPIPGDERVPAASVPWGDRILVVGGGETNRCGHPAALDAWVRDGEASWTEAPFTPAFCAGGAASPAVSGNRAVMVGAGTADVPFGLASDDGVRWTEAKGAFPIGLPSAVAAAPFGFVAFGADDRAAWVERSPDGRHWSEPAGLPAPDGVPAGAGMRGDRVVGIIRAEEGPVFAVSSADGVSWAAERATGVDGNELARVEAIPGGFVGIGGGTELPQLWVSADAVTWRAVSVPAEMNAESTINDVAIAGDRAILVGSARIGGVLGGTAWAAPARVLAP